MRKIHSQSTWAIVGAAVVAVLIGFSALSAQNTILATIFKNSGSPPGPIEGVSGNLMLTLTLNKNSYRTGEISTVTVTIKNSGTEQATIETPDQISIQLMIFDGDMNPIGVWGSAFKKVVMMRPAVSTRIILNQGETYSWAFQWGLGVYATPGTFYYQTLFPGSYIAQSKVSISLVGPNMERPDVGGTTLASGTVPFPVT